MAKGESKTSPRRIEAQEKHVEALELRKGGATYQQIADKLGYSIAGAEKAVKSAMAEMIHEPAQELISLERSRLDALLMAVWSDAIKGNQGAIDRVLKIMERRSKLLGLDMPVKVQNVPAWEDEAIADLRAGKLTFAQIAAFYESETFAAELFKRAGLQLPANVVTMERE